MRTGRDTGKPFDLRHKLFVTIRLNDLDAGLAPLNLRTNKNIFLTIYAMDKRYHLRYRRLAGICLAPCRPFRPAAMPILVCGEDDAGRPANTVLPHCIFIKEKERFRKIDFETILFVEALGSYCCVHLDGGHDMTLSFTLAEITPKLQASFFLRVHRSYIVNMDRVDAFIGNLLCIGSHRIPVSKQHRTEVMRQFNILGSSK